MTDCPKELHYTETHEWIRLDSDDTIIVGITDHAQHQLGDLVFVDLPDVGSKVEKGEEVAVIESVKTAADVYAPLAGEVVSVNEQLTAEPELVNQDAFGAGWLYCLKVSDLSALDNTMDASGYENFIGEE